MRCIPQYAGLNSQSCLSNYMYIKRLAFMYENTTCFYLVIVLGKEELPVKCFPPSNAFVLCRSVWR